MNCWILATETDPPGGVAWSSLHQYRVVRTEQMFAQRLILAELGDIAGDHEIEAVRAPLSVIIVAYCAADLLAGKGVVGSENGSESVLVSE